MPVEPLPCADGGGTTPVEVVTCCAPSIASAPLCRADGTTVLLVVRSGCVECGEAAQDPVAVGWIDASTGTFTPGLLPADAGPCDAGCVDTVCRQLCDDTDGDGEADATYSELWCIRADGAAELVLTYQDDPSMPYTPVAPVDCTYGCPESETVTLCDDSGPFLRRYSFLNGLASYEDVALDGQTPHVVTGIVGVCDTSEPCEAQTTPAATLGLCLADGTPIAVVVTRDCTGAVTQDGWLNLTTGLYSAGDPPVGAMACGNPRSISTTGTFCDVDPGTGDVLGLVLIEYTYGADGSVESVRLVDATTGTTYVPQGEVTTCPAGVEQPERDLVQLCDTAAGVVTEFVRDFARDENGAIVGFTDYTLTGAPYTPTGTVGRCTEPCRDSSSTLLCDTVDQEAVTVFDPANRPGSDGWQVVSFTGDNPGFPPQAALPYDAPHPVGPLMGARDDLNAGPGPSWPGYDLAPHRWVLRKAFTAPEDGIASVSSVGFRGDGGARVRVNSVDAGMYGQWNMPATSGTAQIPVAAGPNVIEIEVRDSSGPNWVQGRLDIVMTRTVQFMRRTVVDCETGETVAVVDTTLDGEPYTVTGAVGQCEPVAECCETAPPEDRLDVETTLMCILGADGESQGLVLVEHVYDDQSGTRLGQRLTDPTTGDSVTLPAGSTLGVCPAAATSCRDTTTLLVCDGPTDGAPPATVTDTDPTPYYPYPVAAPVAGAQVLWDGGTLNLPPGAGPMPGTVGRVNSLAATIQAPRPGCDTGTAHVVVSVNLQQAGPDNGCGPTGHLRLFNGTTQAALTVTPMGTPVGYFGTLTVEADVPAADLAAGTIAVALALDAYDDSGGICAGARRTGWQVSAFTSSATYEQTGCETQFLRNVTTDCETGAVVAVTDTTMDGQPYTVTGEAGQCTPASSGGTVVEPCGDTELSQLCDLTYDPQAPIPTPAGDFALTGNVVAGNGGTTLWFAQANQAANGVAELTVGGLLPAVMYQFRFASAWIGAGAPTPATNNAIYLLEILDGTTVLANRTRNVSNGSNVFPGGVLSEDLPPVAFIAPASGAVTIRFTDQTTGGPVNDRDLFLMPLEVRTAALTLTSTPFLRRFTFDCDGGLTSTQDLALDGATPYEVQGEAGHCTGDGATASAVAPCDVQNVLQACRCDDADGDGIADTDYVELIGVDCEGVLTPMGTYLPDLSAPYTPASPIDCAESDQGAEPASGVQARRVELAAGETWDAAAWTTLQSVTAIAHGGTGTVTTADGPSTLHTGEAATWSVSRDTDALLTGLLTITADTGTVTLSYTIGVTL
ncbi:hypothetical protein [Streptomyces zaomyceticus]|uniref:hypothetical protein n=1 Tax=Streptomyces zaomyceticus TaxID=68286 RepID=UPI0037A5572B